MDSLSFCGSRKRGECCFASECGVDVAVVVRVIAMIRARLENRGCPDRIDTERLEVAELLLDSLEIPAEEVAVEDARALWVFDRLVPRSMQHRRNAPVERGAAGRAAGAAVVVRLASVPKAVGE